MVHDVFRSFHPTNQLLVFSEFLWWLPNELSHLRCLAREPVAAVLAATLTITPSWCGRAVGTDGFSVQGRDCQSWSTGLHMGQECECRLRVFMWVQYQHQQLYVYVYIYVCLYIYILFCFCFVSFCLFLETPGSNSKTSKNNQRKSSRQLGFLAHCTSPVSIIHFRWPFITVEMLFLTKNVLPVLAPTLTSFIFS